MPLVAFFGSRVRSVGHALRGLRTLVATQANARVHLLATLLVAVIGVWLELGPYDWCWLAVAFVLVWTSEALNTAIEFLTDLASPDIHPLARQAKDVAAGGVLIAVVGAMAIGVVVLGRAAGF